MSMKQKSISMTARNVDFLKNEVDAGQYQNESEVVRAGLHLLEREKQKLAIVEEIRTKVQEGIEQANAGLSEPLDTADIKQRGRARLASYKKA